MFNDFRFPKMPMGAFFCACLCAAIALGWATPISAAVSSKARTAQVMASKDANQVGLKLEVDKREVEIGDTVTVTLEFRQAGTGGSVSSQAPSIPTMENFEIRGPEYSSSRVMMVNGVVAQVSTTRIGLRAVKEGQATIGPALALYLDPSGARREIQSNRALVTVVAKKGFSLFSPKAKAPATPPTQTPPPSGATDPDDLRDIRGLVPEPSFPWSWLFWAFTALVAAGYFYRRWKRSRAVVGPVEPPKGAAELLRERFKRLTREETGGLEFCREASSLARGCLSYRYNFPAEDWTSSEILTELARLKAAAGVLDAAENCLKPCDRVLYAEGSLSSVARDNIKQALSSLMPKT